MVRVAIYVEGGGDRQDLRTKCRRGFREFFQKAGFTGRMPSIKACGSRTQAFGRFCTALDQAGDDEFPMLLVDSEDAVASGTGTWEHLQNREGDKWPTPEGATEDHAHMMVQCMESWFLADRESLKEFFGQGYNENALPGRFEIEKIPKRDIFNSLKNATRNSATKGEYGKGDHSFDLLGRIDPHLVTAASPHAQSLLTVLRRILS